MKCVLVPGTVYLYPKEYETPNDVGFSEFVKVLSFVCQVSNANPELSKFSQVLYENKNIF